MENVSIVGLDLAKNVFQAHGARSDGTVAFREKISRAKLIAFFSSIPKCMVAMEACGAAHHWAREIGALGHEVRLIAPIYVKPFVKRNKNDAADAEAIAEAASRPTMRFVAVKNVEKQASGMAFKTRDLLVRQRTQAINALRGHMSEYGVIAPNGPVHIARLADAVNGSDDRLPRAVIGLCRMLLTHIASLGEQIGLLESDLRARARQDETAKRLMTIPGIGVICATALEALAPAAESFGRSRDFAAWLGLTPRQKSSGGKTRLGATSRMGQRDLRRLLICGAVAVVRWALRKGAPEGSWLARMVSRKPPLLTAVALANRTARIAWALMAHGSVYNIPGAVGA
ncbi:MAG: IS110 family transposase [Rhizobiales bacterium]|nr:IS110 family transposase [Hyphomicrobiales bacterium]